MHRVDYLLVAYSLETELQVGERRIPDSKLFRVREVAAIDARNWDRLECWPLTAEQAREVARLLGQEIDGSEADYFLETRPA